MLTIEKQECQKAETRKAETQTRKAESRVARSTLAQLASTLTRARLIVFGAAGATMDSTRYRQLRRKSLLAIKLRVL